MSFSSLSFALFSSLMGVVNFKCSILWKNTKICFLQNHYYVGMSIKCWRFIKYVFENCFQDPNYLLLASVKGRISTTLEDTSMGEKARSNSRASSHPRKISEFPTNFVQFGWGDRLDHTHTLSPLYSLELSLCIDTTHYPLPTGHPYFILFLEIHSINVVVFRPSFTRFSLCKFLQILCLTCNFPTSAMSRNVLYFVIKRNIFAFVYPIQDMSKGFIPLCESGMCG